MTLIRKNKFREEFDSEYVDNLEKEWSISLPRISEFEWFSLFPEAKDFIVWKIEELQKREIRIVENIKSKIKMIRVKFSPLNQWFWREVIKVWDGQDLIETIQQMKRLNNLISVTENKPDRKGQITKGMVERAMQVSMEQVVDFHLVKRGDKLVGLCPFHSEKTPSFTIYPETNSFYCFGCQKGGNVINFVRELYNYNFKEAVMFLNNKI